MTLFASTYEWPTTTIHFNATGQGAHDGSGEVVTRNDRFVLKAPGCFSGATGQPSGRTLRTTIGDEPALIRGTLFVIDGDLGLRVDELRVGSDDDQPIYTHVTAVFEHLTSLCTYRFDDGAKRPLSAPITLPALDGAASMRAVIPSAVDTVRIEAASARALDEFESHLAALQDLLTFASDLPVGRLHLSATDVEGRNVDVFGRERFAPFNKAPRQPIEYSLRLSGDWLHDVVDGWWLAQETLRPIPQLVAGLHYQPGYVEADVILSASAIEALATRTVVGESPRLSDGDAAPILAALGTLTALNADQRQVVAAMKAEASRTTLRAKVELLLATVDSTAIENARITLPNWLPHFIATRNGIAHGGRGSRPTQDIWIDDELLRTVRDANHVLLALAILTHLGVPGAAIECAAERLGVRYGARHRAASIFQ